MISGILALSISSILNNWESSVLHFTTVGARYLDPPRDREKGWDKEGTLEKPDPDLDWTLRKTGPFTIEKVIF